MPPLLSILGLFKKRSVEATDPKSSANVSYTQDEASRSSYIIHELSNSMFERRLKKSPVTFLETYFVQEIDIARDMIRQQGNDVLGKKSRFLLAQKRAARSLKKFDPDWVSTISTATAHVVAEELMLPRSEYIENYALRKSDGRLVDALHGFVKPALVFNYQDPETGLVTRHSAFDVFMANELLFPAISRLKPVHIRKSNFVMNYPSSVVTVSPVKHVLDGLINGKYVDVSSRDPSSGKDIYEIACDKLDHKLIRDLVNYYDFDPRAKNPQTGLSGLNALAQALAGATPSEVLDYQRCVRELFVVGVRESEVAALARRYIKEEAENMAKLEGNFSKQTASLEMS